MTMTLETVPSPGRWRSGIQRSRTSAPTMQTHMPVPRPMRRDRPWWKTSHGSAPSPASRISAALAP